MGYRGAKPSRFMTRRVEEINRFRKQQIRLILQSASKLTRRFVPRSYYFVCKIKSSIWILFWPDRTQILRGRQGSRLKSWRPSIQRAVSRIIIVDLQNFRPRTLGKLACQGPNSAKSLMHNELSLTELAS